MIRALQLFHAHGHTRSYAQIFVPRALCCRLRMRSDMIIEMPMRHASRVDAALPRVICRRYAGAWRYCFIFAPPLDVDIYATALYFMPRRFAACLRFDAPCLRRRAMLIISFIFEIAFADDYVDADGARADAVERHRRLIATAPPFVSIRLHCSAHLFSCLPPSRRHARYLPRHLPCHAFWLD